MRPAPSKPVPPADEQQAVEPGVRSAWLRWPFAVAALLLVAGLAGLTGSSYGYGASVDPLLEPAARGARRELLGHHRAIRSDEYAVDLPTARAQQLSEPRFAAVNLDLGVGHMQRNTFDAPVLDWGAPFRPFTWPLFLPGLWSHGLRWFWRAFLLFVGLQAWFAVALQREDAGPREARARAAVAALVAGATFLCGQYTWWLSHPMPQIVALVGIAVYCGSRAARARPGRGRWGWWTAFAYTGSAAFFSFYPPIWAPILWVACATLFDLHWRRTGRVTGAVVRTAPFVATLAAGVLVAIAYFAPYLALVADTAYPGRRVAASGQLPVTRFIDLAWPSLQVRAPAHSYEVYRGLEPFVNACEAAAVEAIPLYLLLALAFLSGTVREAVRLAARSMPMTLVALAVLGAWLFCAMPAWFGDVTLLRWTPWNRAWMAFGLTAALFCGRILAELEAGEPAARFSWKHLGAAVVVLAGLWFFARRTIVGVDGRLLNSCGVAAAAMIAGVATLHTRWPARIIAMGWLASLAIANALVNPVVPTSTLFARGAGHAVVDRALEEVPGRIVDYTNRMGSTLAGFGWPVLGHVAMAPDLDLFRYLEPDSPGLSEDLYNRYAHVHFVLPPEQTRLVFADSFQAVISPCSERLATLGVNHFLAPADAALPPECSSEFSERHAADVKLWTRRDPVRRVGVSSDLRASRAEDFDFRAETPAGTLEVGRWSIALAAPAGRSVAFAVNRSVIDSVRCEGGTATFADAHVIVHATAGRGARCEFGFLGTAGALRRLVLGHPAAATTVSAAHAGNTVDSGRMP